MSVLRLLTVYNESDIIRENIQYYISQGVETVVLDNYSKDGTYEILKEYEGKGIRWIERLKTDYYDIIKLNTILLNLVLKNEKEQYFIWADADEITCPFNTKFKLIDFVPKAFEVFNVDAFVVSKFEFYLTNIHELKKGINSITDFKYCIFEKNWKKTIFRKNEFLQTYVDMPYYFDKDNNELSYKTQENIFFIKHFPYRSLRQAKRKIYRGIPKKFRNKNIDASNIDILNKHYLWYKEDFENRVIRKRDDLLEFENHSDFYMNFMIKKYPESEKDYNFFLT